MGQTDVEEDVIMIFQAHTMYFFEEDCLPIDPKEEEFTRIQEAVVHGGAIPTNV